MEQPPKNHPQPMMRSNWPTTFGILAIIFGILGFLNSAYQVFWMGMMQKMGVSSVFPTMPSSNPQEEAVNEMMKDMMSNMVEIGRTKIYVDGALAILAVTLFAGGVLLLLRYRFSRPLLLFWSYGKIAAGLLGTLLTQKVLNIMGGSMGTMMDEQMQDLSGGSGTPPPIDMVQIYEIMGSVYLVFGAIWIAILPALFLFWLNRRDIKQDIATGYGWK